MQNTLFDRDAHRMVVHSAAMLVGGRSTRMGRDKADLEWEGSTFLLRIASRLLEVFPEVLLIGDCEGRTLPGGVRCVPDMFPDSGPLAGIHSALIHASCDAVFVTACDTPRITASAVRAFLDLWGGSPAFVASDGDRIHPLFGVYTRYALPAIEAAFDRGEFRLRPLLLELGATFAELKDFNVSGIGDMLANVNTPEEYARLLEAQRGTDL